MPGKYWFQPDAETEESGIERFEAGITCRFQGDCESSG